MQMDHQERRAWVQEVAALLGQGYDALERQEGNGFFSR